MRRLVIYLFSCLLFVMGVGAQNFPAPMNPPRLVNDFAGLMSRTEQQELERRLQDFDRKTSTQIAVVTMSDLEGYAPGDYAQRLHEFWGVGGKGKDNGILILIKPKTAGSKGEVFISVGYGLEGVVPDITAGRIIDREMLPAFREGKIYEGINNAITVLMQLTQGEFTADQYNHRNDNTSLVTGVVVFLLFWIVLLLYVRSSRRRGGGGNNGSGSGGGLGRGWLFPLILMGGGRRGGGGGFGSGGGFGGFGGGRAGGAGAGRSW